MTNYPKLLGKNIKTARQAVKLSQEKLALETNIDRSYTSGIERGVRNPSLNKIIRIANRLDKTPAELFTE